MKISQKIIIMVSAVIFFYTLASFAVIRIFIAPGFNNIELVEAKKDMARAKSAIEREINAVNSFCADYARWDDTYRFIQTGYADYTESNFSYESMKQQVINYACITDSNGRIIYSIYFDKQTGKEAHIPDEKDSSSPLRQLINDGIINNDKSYKGIIASSKGFLILTSFPVTDSKLLLPSNGRFFAGRFFGKEQIDTISTMFKIEVSISPANSGSAAQNNIFQKIISSKKAVYETSPSNIIGHDLISDIRGQPLALLTSVHPKVFAGNIISPLNTSLLVLISCGLIVLASLIVILRKNVIEPLTSLTMSTSRLTKLHESDERLPQERNDEIGILTYSFNRLLDRLYIANTTLENRIAARTEELEKSNSRLTLMRQVFNSSIDGIIITDSQGIITNVNAAFTHITGFQECDVVGTDYGLMRSERNDEQLYADMGTALSEKGRWTGELWSKNKRGRNFPERVSISTINDDAGAILYIVCVFHDISDAKQQESYIKYQAFHDALTGLPNRILLNDRMIRTIHMAEKRNSRFALLYLDLDNFKTINDSLGHEYGDILLQHVSERLEKLTRTSDTVSRMGGDEFVILLDDITEDKQPAHLAVRIIDSFNNSFVIKDQIFHVGTSIGIAVFPDDGTDAGTLIRNADTAMYKAKEEGRHCYRHFTNALNERVAYRLRLEADLRLAMEANQFEVYYQPKMALSEGSICGFEGLARWIKNGSIISPADFIPMAEESGLITQLDRIILEIGCRQIAQYNRTAVKPLKIAVNASAKTIQKKKLPDEIREVLAQTGMDPSWLEVEITETDVMKNLDECLAVIKKISDMGISIALDDFGIGYSSLAQLSKIPVNTLKIDKSFVDMITGKEPVSIIETIYAMARDLKLSVVAEGVETENQLAYLTSLGCDSIQGYLISKPIPFSEVDGILSKFVQKINVC